MEKLVSIVVPVYMIEQYIERCILSILNQTYKNYELILVDDGSKDASASICDAYTKKDSRIKVIHQENQGVSTARNTALDVAKGEYILFVDGDDFIEKEYIQTLVRTIEKNHGNIGYIGNTYYYENGLNNTQKNRQSDKRKSLITNKNEICNSKEAISKLLHLKIRQSVWGCIFSKKIVEDLRFKKDISYAEDWEYLVNAFLKADSIVFNESILYNYCIREDSAMKQPFNVKYLSEISMLDDMMNKIVSRYPDFENECKARKLHSYFGIIRLIEFDKNRKKYLNIEKEMLEKIKKDSKGLLWNHKIDFGVKVKILSVYFGGARLYGIVQKTAERIIGL